MVECAVSSVPARFSCTWARISQEKKRIFSSIATGHTQHDRTDDDKKYFPAQQ